MSATILPVISFPKDIAEMCEDRNFCPRSAPAVRAVTRTPHRPPGQRDYFSFDATRVVAANKIFYKTLQRRC